MARQKTPGKKITEQAVIGEQGINLIQRIVLDMGCVWHPTNQAVEVGIDGEIELVRPDTREATNAIIRLQSKATVRRFTAETEQSFEFLCDDRDLAYWLSGNAPVILVVSRPHTGEAYWVPLKKYFSSAAARKERRICFDKSSMRFSKSSLQQLWEIALPRSQGLYFAPRPRTETLYTNLLQVSRKPERLWLADTEVRRPADVFARLRESGIEAPEFVLKNKRILAAHDLHEEPWRGLVDLGTVDDFEASEWADSEDPDRRRLFVELLNRCLTARARQIGVYRRRDDDALFFCATRDLSAWKLPFQSVKESTERTVFQGYPYTKGARIGEIAYYRHSACHAQFRRYDGSWYLEILPTYHFTSDGRRGHPFAERYLAGIKRKERQGAVLYQVVMWASLLRGSENREIGTFMTNTYPFLGFSQLQTFTLDVGIDDKAWLPNEDKETQDAGRQTLGDLPLFVALGSETRTTHEITETQS